MCKYSNYLFTNKYKVLNKTIFIQAIVIKIGNSKAVSLLNPLILVAVVDFTMDFYTIDNSQWSLWKSRPIGEQTVLNSIVGAGAFMHCARPQRAGVGAFMHHL